MSNPWLDVPLADYEGHMNSAEVRQLAALADLFAEALTVCRPASVAILGIAGGNGLDRIDTGVTRRIVGIDINPTYLDAVRQRYTRLRGLELECANLSVGRLDLQPAQLIHAALVFEHAGVDLCLENALSLVGPGGALSVVLQLPSESEAAVSPTPFRSIQNLKSHFSLIDPEWLSTTLAQHHFRPIHQAHRSLPAAKAFWMGIFARH
jgi:hypothetical protein